MREQEAQVLRDEVIDTSVIAEVKLSQLYLTFD